MAILGCSGKSEAVMLCRGLHISAQFSDVTDAFASNASQCESCEHWTLIKALVLR